MVLLIKQYQLTLPLSISHLQTDRQMHRYTTMYDDSSRYPLPSYQMKTMCSFPIQSDPHTCEFHQLPTTWPKKHPKIALLWLPQVHLLSHLLIKHCLKTGKYVCINMVSNFTFLGLSCHCLRHCLLEPFRQCLLGANGHSLTE